MPGMKKIVFAVLSLLLVTGCAATGRNLPSASLQVDPTGRIFAVLPVADYSYIQDVEAAYRQQMIVQAFLANGLARKGFPVSPLPAVYQVLTDSGVIAPMSYEKDVKPRMETGSLEGLLNEGWSDMMKSEIVSLIKSETRRSIPGIAIQDNHLSAPATAVLDREGVLNLGRELGAEYILRSRLLVYDLRQEYPVDPLRRQILSFFQGRNGLQHFGTAKAVHYDTVDTLVVGGALTDVGRKNDHSIRLQAWLQDAVTGDVVWSRRVIEPIEEDDFVTAAAHAADELIAYLVATVPVDRDGDGVWDHRDKCPGTPADVQVDTFGCPRAKAQTLAMEDPAPAEQESMVVQENLEIEKLNWPEFSDELSVELRVEFDFDKADIKPIYLAELERVAAFLKEHPATKALIEGHTDDEGTKEYNMTLSSRRAENVKGILVKQFGIDPSRLKAVGFGKSKPLADNQTEEGRQKNRRAVAVISAAAK